MASARSQDQFCCSICLELFNKPVTVPCGHNFCKPCISQYWDNSGPCRCPLCNEIFSSKPELNVNLLLSEMVSQFKQQTGSSPVVEEKSKPGEVRCDAQPEIAKEKEEKFCPKHHRALEIFCRTDHSCLCLTCLLQEHKNHEFVSLKEEFDQRRSSLRQTQVENRHMVEQRRLKVQEIKRSMEISQTAANRETTTGLQAFTALIESVQKRRDQFLEEVQEMQKQIQIQAQELVQELEQEICALERRSSEAEQLSHSEDILLLLSAPSPALILKKWSTEKLKPENFEGTAAKALSELGLTLTQEFKKMELKRVQQFAVNLTLDPDTANPFLALSDDLKKVHDTAERKFSDSPLRFSWRNAITKQSFSSSKFYFEVQVKDKISWTLGVAKASAERARINALTSVWGYWGIHMENKECFACPDAQVPLSLKAPPQKIGVFVDYTAGLVSFYDVDSADLLYSYTDCYFQDKLFPFLNPNNYYEGKNSAPLILTQVKK